MQVIAIDDTQATCEIDGVKRETSLLLLDDVEIGDFVLIHAGFAIEKLDQAEAEKTLELFREVLADGGAPT